MHIRCSGLLQKPPLWVVFMEKSCQTLTYPHPTYQPIPRGYTVPITGRSSDLSIITLPLSLPRITPVTSSFILSKRKSKTPLSQRRDRAGLSPASLFTRTKHTKLLSDTCNAFIHRNYLFIIKILTDNFLKHNSNITPEKRQEIN